MDKNRIKSIKNITNDLHNKLDDIFEDIMSEDFDTAAKSVSVMEEQLKHLKQNLKIDEI